MFNTDYASFDQQFKDKLTQIKLLACDVDGVFSDGSIYLGNQREEFKAFNTKDGYGVKALGQAGITVAIITGRRSNIVEQRMTSLGVQHIVQGEDDKQKALMNLMVSLKLTEQHVASMGDDIPDIGMFSLSAIKIAVADAHPGVTKQANWITTMNGGRGAVREVCDTLLQAQGSLGGIQATST
jgi:3-deoxy-D-manno-octulosonate 8-phosphate phosphatase (KDO 8-P phosphatase)